ncbi:unnamed protein product, partial [Mesorhabditis belari]|uniref:Amine oxidase domain-containing protein n=1 Tax=Mesorhabditis belari TaxID=2138241 RepID=A0AAF3EG40_9BILA
MPVRIVIIGSGPTALGAALRLNELQIEGGLDLEISILEKEDAVGGLASSVTDKRGFTWDLGVHVTGGSKYTDFISTINEAVGEWNEIPRCVKANMSHIIQAEAPMENYIPYPVQDSIPYFPDYEKACCLADIEKIEAENSQVAPQNFAEFSRKVFGETLQELFIRPYNEKVWTIGLDELSCGWVEGRVPQPNGKMMAKRCALSLSELHAEEESKPRVLFRYPAKLKGVGAMWKRITEKLPKSWVHLGKSVEKIDSKTRTVFCSDKSKFEYDYLISTMPLVELGRITGLAPEIQLKHSKVVLVGLGLRRPQPETLENFSWVYFPQPEIVFYRCTFLSNFNEYLTPNAAVFWSVICEIGLPSNKKIDEKEKIEKTIEDLKSVGILREDVQIVSKWIHSLPFGYPIPTVNRDDELRKWQPIFESKRIYSRGRFGSWKYEVANQDHSFTMGRQVIDRIFMGEEETVHGK